MKLGFNQLMEERLMPVSQKVSTSKYLVALRDGLMLSMPLLIIGSLCIVIADFPLPAFQDFMGSLLGEAWEVWCWDIIIPATNGLIALLAIIGTSYTLAAENEVEPLPAVALGMSAYFLLLQQQDGGYSPGDFEAQGLFAALLTAIVVTQIYTLILEKKWVIKMPNGVPSFVTRQFEALTPAIVIIPLFMIIRLIFAATQFGTLSNFIVEVLQMPLTNIGTSLLATLVITFINSLLWFFGIHGTAVVDSIMAPLWYNARFVNLEAFQSSVEAVRPFIVTQDFANLIIFLGGTGNTIALSILMTFKCKSQRIRSLGKLSLIPGLFNVNEPIIFGLPIVLNPIMAIPFFIVPPVSVLISYAAMYVGLVPYPTGVTVPWTMPAPLGGWMMCGDIRGGILQIVILLVAGLIYYPFIHTLDKQYLRDEQEALTQSE